MGCKFGFVGMMVMAKTKLRELSLNNLEYGSGSASVQYDGHTRYIRITDIDDEGHLNDAVVSPKEINEKYILKDGDILFARTGATVGKTYRYRKTDGNCIYAGYLIRFVPNPDLVYPDYIWYFTKSPQYMEFIRNSMKVVAQPNINAKQYGDLEIEVPLKATQEVIIKRLTGISKIINERRYQLRALDTLIKARFVEMFGDPEINPNGYPVRSMADIATYWNGLTYKPEDVSEEGTIVLRSSNIQNMQLDFADTVRVSCKIGEKKYVQENDILMCSRNGSAKLVGKVALIKGIEEPMSFGAFMMIIRSEYYSYLMTYFQLPAFRAQIVTGATTTINQITGSMMDKVFVPVPDKKTMNEFATFVSQVDKSKAVVQEALEKTQLLFDSLMQQYFG